MVYRNIIALISVMLMLFVIGWFFVPNDISWKVTGGAFIMSLVYLSLTSFAHWSIMFDNTPMRYKKREFHYNIIFSLISLLIFVIALLIYIAFI